MSCVLFLFSSAVTIVVLIISNGRHNNSDPGDRPSQHLQSEGNGSTTTSVTSHTTVTTSSIWSSSRSPHPTTYPPVTPHITDEGLTKGTSFPYRKGRKGKRSTKGTPTPKNGNHCERNMINILTKIDRKQS